MDEINLERFYEAQKQDFDCALAEIQNGYKESHWMWYIFPQIDGLGRSPTAQFYAIKSFEEAVAFLEDPYLGENLREISGELLKKETNNAEDIFGYVDAMKLRSSMTLFYYAGGITGDNEVFYSVLMKYFNGAFDEKTIELIEDN